jgi:hypothetical protein
MLFKALPFVSMNLFYLKVRIKHLAIDKPFRIDPALLARVKVEPDVVAMIERMLSKRECDRPSWTELATLPSLQQFATSLLIAPIR